MECFKCGVSDKRALLFDAISAEGIIKVCKKCNLEEKLPLVRKPLELNHSLLEKKPEEESLSVYERMKKLSGHRPFNKLIQKQSNEALQKQDSNLRELVDQNFKSKSFSDKRYPEGLVENFHWKLMRARRLKKLTQKELAEKIKVPLDAIILAEQGFVPKDDFKLLLKLEDELKVKIILNKDSMRENISEESSKPKEVFEQVLDSDEIDFDPVYTKNITIADLQKIKKEKVNQVPESVRKKDEILDKENLTEEEIDDIIFGRK